MLGFKARSRPVRLRSRQEAGPTTSNTVTNARTLKRTLQGGVEGALAVAFEVEGDVEEAGGLEASVDGGGHLWSEREREFVGSDFDASEFVMQANAELAEAEV